MVFNFIQLGISFIFLILLLLLGFSGLKWLHIPAGSLLDWVIGGASFLWLLTLVTVPWNIYFQAKATLADAEVSAERDIPVNPEQVAYVRKLIKRSQFVAVALHLLSAVGLYILSATGISVVGYVSSGAALLLTIVRPAISAYQYFLARLSLIRREFSYPREDVIELCSRVANLETTVKTLEDQMDPNQPYSWAETQQRGWEETRKELARLSAIQTEQEAKNQVEHDRLSREARQAIAQLTTDGQFLDHVREIIRFFKTA